MFSSVLSWLSEIKYTEEGHHHHHHYGCIRLKLDWMSECAEWGTGEQAFALRKFEQANRHYETNVVKLMTCNLFCKLLHSLFYLLDAPKRIEKPENVINYAKYLHTLPVKSIVSQTIQRTIKYIVSTVSSFNRCAFFMLFFVVAFFLLLVCVPHIFSVV